MKVSEIAQGEKTRLRLYRDKDFSHYWDLLHDREVFPHMGATDADERAVREKMRGLAESANNLVCVIEARSSGDVVGITSLLDITPEHYRAKIALTMLASGFRGNGYALDARRALYAHAFTVLGLRTLYGFVFVENTRNKAHLEQLGFREIAVIPKWGVPNSTSELCDEFLMLLSRDDFFRTDASRYVEK